MLLIDLDRFKEINDTLGHQRGDDVLEQAGQSRALAVRESDTVARLGGDEFAIVSPRTDAAGALTLAEKLRVSLACPVTISGIDLEIDASIGIALFPDNGADAETLMRRADVALYLSKEAHVPTLYAAEQDHYSPERLALVTDLRRAVHSREELVVYFQPQADVASGEIVRVEALVRWRHPSQGLLTPDAFLPLAERTGLTRPLTRLVLDASLQQCRAWRERGLDVAVAVNVSGRDLLDVALPDEVNEALHRYGVPADRLELEITENTILTDPVRARSVLARLSALGVSLAIDDFGAGYSSLGYLKRLSVDVLKIDRSFVINMSRDDNDEVIVRSTIELGHTSVSRSWRKVWRTRRRCARLGGARLRRCPGLFPRSTRAGGGPRRAPREIRLPPGREARPGPRRRPLTDPATRSRRARACRPKGGPSTAARPSCGAARRGTP